MTTFQTSREIDESRQRASLRRMRMISTLLLAGMAVVYVITASLEKAYPFLGAVRAFAEAAMVGALADWFAVVALFRHPLNLPIPHTAIIQTHKDRFGENLANFIKNNFLARETLEERLGGLDFTGWIGRVMTDRQKVHAITAKLTEELNSLLGQFNDDDLKHFSAGLILNTLAKVKLAPLIGDVLTMMVREGKHQELLGEVLALIDRAVDQNKAEIREKTRGDHPWWIPDFVDELIFNKMVAKIEETIRSIQENSEHEVRRKLDEASGDFIYRLKHSEDLSLKINAMGQDFFAHPGVKKYFEGVWSDIKARLMSDMTRPDSAFQDHIEKGILLFGESLEKGEWAKEGLNRWIHTSLVNLAEEYADAIISIVSETVKQWDAARTSRTIELYVGKDLQWIRINGTLVGGLVGLLIYAVSMLFR